MSWATERVFLDHPDHVTLYDSTKPENGAPGKPGEYRFCMGELESGQLAFQKRQLCLVDVGANVTKSSVLEHESGEAATADALGAADLPVIRCAGVVPYRVNQNLQGGEAEGTLPGTATTKYWAWLVVDGRVDLIADANIAVDAPLITKSASGTAGRVDDAAVTGLEHCIIGRSLEAVTGGAGTLFEAYVHIR